jgi:putative membrane protein
MSSDPSGASITTELANQRTELANQRTELANQRTELAGNRTRWAADRTLWAADRTFIAWLRTAISMICFGIGIGKAGDVLEDYGYAADPTHGLQIVGLALVTLGVLGLLGALIQDVRIGRRLAKAGFGRVEPTPLGQVMGILVLLVGIFGAIVIFL